MGSSRQTPKNRFTQIFIDGWAVVQKRRGCGDPAKGYAVYRCPDCQARRVVAFRCTSQFGRSCAPVHGATWVETVPGMRHPGVAYRQLTLTMPQAPRPLVYQHAAVLLAGFMQAVQRAMDAVVIIRQVLLPFLARSVRVVVISV